MKFCEYCGHKNPIEARFCENCGKPLIEVAENNTTQTTTEPTNHFENNQGGGETPPLNQRRAASPKSPKKPMSLKTKIVIGAGVVVVAALFGAYQYGANYFSKENAEERFFDALAAGNTNQVLDYLSTKDKNLELTQDSIQPMLDYFLENKSEMNELRDAFESDYGYLGFSLEQDGKSFMLFDNYTIDVSPVYRTVTTNFTDVVITVNEKELLTSDSDDFSKEIGPFVPGKYTFMATGEDSAGQEMILENEYDLFSDSYDDIDLSFIMVRIPIESNIDDAEIYLDGEAQGSLSEGEGLVGPVLWHEGMTIQLKKTLTDGDLVTEEEEIYENDYDDSEDQWPLTLDFDLLDEYDAEYALKTFYDEFAEVVESDVSYDPEAFATTFYENGSSNEAFTGINEYINWCRQRHADDTYSGVYFRLNVTELEPLGNDLYNMNYNVVYNTSYPSDPMRIEGFDYTGCKVQIIYDADEYEYQFKFVNMGDGGVKVSDNQS